MAALGFSSEPVFRPGIEGARFGAVGRRREPVGGDPGEDGHFQKAAITLSTDNQTAQNLEKTGSRYLLGRPVSTKHSSFVRIRPIPAVVGYITASGPSAGQFELGY